MQVLHLVRRLILCCLCLLLLPYLAAEGPPARSQSAFDRSQSSTGLPPVCAILAAAQPATPSGPASETASDTQRIQSALDACPAGQAVELTPAPVSQDTAFLTAPLTLPPGVTLILDASVTLFASRNPADYDLPNHSPCGQGPCRALLTAVSPAAPNQPSALMGFGILDARGRATLLIPNETTPETWSTRPNRPTLLDVDTAFTLAGVTLRDAPAIALHARSAAPLILQDAKFTGTPTAQGTDALVLDPAATSVSLSNTTLTTAGSALTAATLPALTAVSLHAGSLPPSIPQPTQLPCILNSLSCTPALQPPFTTELFASMPDPSRPDLTLNAVLIPPDSAFPAATGTVQFFDGDTLLGAASIRETLATLILPTLAPGPHHFHAVLASPAFPFGDLTLTLPTTHAADASASTTPALTLTADRSTAPVYTAITFTAVLTAASNPTGSVTFSANGAVLATVPLTGNTAALTTASLLSGPQSITATYSGDASNPAVTSPPVQVTLTGLPAPFTLTAAPPNSMPGTYLTLSAVGLPPAATGTVTFTDNGAPISTININRAASAIYYSFGDSITAGFLLTNPFLQSYPSLFGKPLGLYPQDLAVPGYTACDIMPLELLKDGVSPSQSAVPLYSLMVGTNDADLYSTGSHEAVFQTCHQAALAWLAIPREYKVLAGDPAAQPISGTWTHAATYDSTFSTLYNASGSGTARFTLTTAGAPAYLWYLLQDGLPGAFTLAIDGVPTSTTYQTSPNPIAGGYNGGSGIALLRFPLAAGVHTFAITVQSGAVGILGVATAPGAGAASVHPTVLVSDLPYQRIPDGASSNAVLDQYSADALADTTLLTADGLNLVFVPTHAFMLGTPAEMADNIHPGPLGHEHLAAAFAAVTLPPQPDTLFGSATQSTYSSLASPGIHTLAATYSGDAVYAPSTAVPLAFPVADPSTTTILTASASSLVLGNSVTVTAAVSSNAPTGTPAGTISVLDTTPAGTVTLGSAPLVNGSASLPATLSIGLHTLTAAFASTDLHAWSTSAPIPVTITPVPSILTAGPVKVTALGLPIPLTFTVAPSTATGTLAVTDPATGQTLGQATLLNGAATLTIPTVPASTHTLTATYSGDTLTLPASTQLPLTITPISPSILATPPNPTASFGSPLTITVNLAGFATLPAAFPATTLSPAINATTDFLGDSLPAQWTLPLNNLGVPGQSTAQVAARMPAVLSSAVERTVLLAGTDELLSGQSSPAAILASLQTMATEASQVNARLILCTLPPIFAATPAAQSAAAQLPALNAAILTLAAAHFLPVLDLYTPLAHHPELFADGIHPNAAGYALLQSALAQFLLVPTGSITLPDGSSVPLSITGTALINLKNLAPGSTSVTLTYSGDADFFPSSFQSSVQITPAPTTTQLDAQPLAGYVGSSAVLTASVATQAGVTPAGSITFLDGGTPLGSATLNPAASATFTTSTLTNGTHTFTAAYSGSTSLAASTSPAATLPIRFAATTLALAASTQTAVFANPVTLTATVSQPAATGTATLLEGTTTLAQSPVRNGSATFTLTTLTPGSHTLTATYSGDANDAPAQSSPQPLHILPIASTLTLGSLPATILTGRTVTLTTTLQPASATGSITFLDGSIILGRSPLANASATLANLTLPIGAHTLSAQYFGDTDDSSAITPAVTLQVTPIPTTASLTAQTLNSTSGPSAVLATTVTPTASGAPPTGTVTWTDGPTTLATIPITPNLTATFTTPNLANGTHTFLATYSGDATHAAATSAPSPLTVHFLQTTLTLTASATTAPYNTAITLTASASAASATGSITFFDGTTTLGQSTLTNGLATLTVSTLTPGVHTLTATYTGDANDAPAQSPALAIRIVPITTVLSLSPLPATAVYATALPITASVQPSTATGTLTFSDGNTPIGQATLVNGLATLTTSTLTVGTHTLTAAYSGDPDDSPAASTPATLTITTLPTTLTLTAPPATVPYGTPIPLAATLTPAAATGAVTFTDSITGLLTTAPVQNGAAAFTTAKLAPGLHTFTLTYSGDPTHAASASSAAATLITTLTTTLALSPIPATVLIGAPVTLTAVLTPATATGTVTFRDANAGPIGQAALLNGTATLTLTTLTAGPHTFSATYTGDPDDAPTATTTSISTTITLNPTTTTLDTLPATAYYSAPITLTASVAAPTATGTITFTDAATGPLGTALLTNGTATFKLATLPTGLHTFSAVYSGDTLNLPSKSTSIPLTILDDTTATLLTLAQTTIPAGAPVTFNVRVTTPLATTPTGTVTIRAQSQAGPIVLAAGALTNTLAGQSSATFSASSTALGLGTFTSVIALYSGDASNSLSDSSATPITFTILPTPTTATLTLPSTELPIGASTTLTASVTSSTGAVPTGAIVFTSNNTTLATVPLNSSGQAATNLTAPPIGAYTLNATYVPTGLFAPATAPTQTLTISPPVALTLAPATLTLQPGANASTTLTMIPLSGFTGAVAVSCISPQAFITCTLDAPTAIGPATPANATVHIAIPSSTVALASFAPANTRLTTLFLTLLLLLTVHPRTRRRLPILATVLLAAVLAITTSGCGTGGTFYNIPTGKNTVQLQVTAAGTTAATTLTVSITQGTS